MSDVMIRDVHGVPCAIDEARDEIRHSLGDGTDEVLAENGHGRVHPSQHDRLERYVRSQRRIVYFVVIAPVASLAFAGIAAAVVEPNLRARIADWVVLGLAGGVVLAFACGSSVGQSISVETVRGRVEAFGDGSTGQPRLGKAVIPLDRRWIGAPVVAHVVRCGMTTPLYLSGDLDVDRVSPIAVAGPEPVSPLDPAGPPPPSTLGTTFRTPAPTPTRDFTVAPDDRVREATATLLVAIASTALAVWAFVALLGSDDPGTGVVAVVLLWGVWSVLAVLLHAVMLSTRHRERRSTYAIRADPNGDVQLVVVTPRSERAWPLAELRTIRARAHRSPRDAWFELAFADGTCQLGGVAGQRVVERVRGVRPDVAVAVFQPVNDGSGGS